MSNTVLIDINTSLSVAFNMEIKYVHHHTYLLGFYERTAHLSYLVHYEFT